MACVFTGRGSNLVPENELNCLLLLLHQGCLLSPAASKTHPTHSIITTFRKQFEFLPAGLMLQRSLSAPGRKELARKTSISLNFRKKKKMQRKRPCKKHRCSPVTSKRCVLFLGLFEVERSLMIGFSCVSWRL